MFKKNWRRWGLTQATPKRSLAVEGRVKGLATFPRFTSACRKRHESDNHVMGPGTDVRPWVRDGS